MTRPAGKVTSVHSVTVGHFKNETFITLERIVLFQFYKREHVENKSSDGFVVLGCEQNILPLQGGHFSKQLLTLY